MTGATATKVLDGNCLTAEDRSELAARLGLPVEECHFTLKRLRGATLMARRRTPDDPPRVHGSISSDEQFSIEEV